MKNNTLLILLVVVVGVASGVGLLFGIGNAVNVAVAPMTVQLAQVSSNESKIAEKLALLEKKYDALEEKLKQRPVAPSAPVAQEEDLNKVYDIPVGQSPIIGKKEAPNTIVEFTDLQCPFCSRFFPGVKQVLADYPDKVRLIIKNFPLPFHPNARPAAKLALAANEQGKYYEMIQELLENGAKVDEDSIKGYVSKLGLDAKKLADDYKNKDAQWEAMIQADEKLVQEVDVRGTPTFFLNGKKSDARDISEWKAELDKL